jgi:HK97 family phage prohead protease
LYDTPTVIQTPFGAFDERIEPGALATAILDGRISAVREHDPARLLGRVMSRTLQLIDGPNGLDVRVELPDTEYGREAATLVQRGDLRGMSFSFTGITDTWHKPAERGGRPTRVIQRIARMFDVSIVTWPAYEQTFVRLLGDDARNPRNDPATRGRELRMQQIAAKTGLSLRRAAPPLGEGCAPPARLASWVRAHRRQVRIGCLDKDRAA